MSGLAEVRRHRNKHLVDTVPTEANDLFFGLGHPLIALILIIQSLFEYYPGCRNSPVRGGKSGFYRSSQPLTETDRLERSHRTLSGTILLNGAPSWMPSVRGTVSIRPPDVLISEMLRWGNWSVKCQLALASLSTQ